MSTSQVSSDRTESSTAKRDVVTPRIWVLQPRVRAYRLPFWERLIQFAGGSYELTVCGPLDELRASGDDRRPYLREWPIAWRSILGRSVGTWLGAADAVRRERPDVVVYCASTPIVTCWTLPAICRRLGIVNVAWTKVHGQRGERSWWGDWIKRRFYRRFDLALCYGRQSLDELVSLGFPREKASIAQNTVDTDFVFAQPQRIAQRAATVRRNAGLADQHRPIVCIGRMIERKRHLDLVEAWPRLRELDANLRLVLVGAGPQFERVRRRAEEIDRERIVVTGSVPSGDDYAWLHAAEVVVLPGALGLAINQALALGRPTIVADEWGSDSEILEHARTGWRYPRGDREALVAAVRHVLTDRLERERVTAAACEMMRGQVTLDNMVRQFDAAMRAALAMRGR